MHSPKAHVPFRADDFEHGKRTGLAVGYVDRRSDEFEAFDQVISQADKVTPPRVKANGRKRKKALTPVADEEYDDEEYGEASMDLVDSNPPSPAVYFTSARQTIAPSSIRRTGSSSRPVPHSSDVDFDTVPSPRPRTSSAAPRRQSTANGPGPSALSRVSITREEVQYEEDVDLPPSDLPDYDYGPSFAHLDQDDDDDDDDAEEQQVVQSISPAKRGRQSSPADTRQGNLKRARQLSNIPDRSGGADKENTVPRSTGKGKERQRDEEMEEQEQSDVEDAVDPGLQEADDMPMDLDNDAQQEEEEERPSSKKARLAKEKENPKPKKPRAPRKRQEVMHIPLSQDSDNGEHPGVRRSRRVRYGPLEWWRLEKVVYGRRDSGVTYVPHIKEIIRLPKEPVQPLGKAGRKGRKKTREGSRAKTGTAEPEVEVVPAPNPEEGWDDQTEPKGIILDYVTKQEVERRIAFTAKMLEPKAAANNDFFFQRVFGDAEFMAAGYLMIPPGKAKPSKQTKDNTYAFYVIEGAVNFHVHKTSVIVATGGMFLVPRGNQYFIQNICERDAKLFFAQARKIPLEEVDAPPALLKPGTSSARRSLGPGQNGRHSSGAASAAGNETEEEERPRTNGKVAKKTTNSRKS
ncbi:hypothetical protein GLOTRDRAFT_136648 [Gloeophyllum trabeum ATCC 11539]|uniref:CENP-C homolog n=1 Tax=Gloeophyllum trabeum (strain ATCC 11539 / FP-39264 / Madison 617) TaxID=670483 RepID=S7QD38_GLOTA|nr:uncharacterized protein GLOTRDRAFT_136648 [Gloeophyllum trabeum ATCC 11539]EPQ57776.1 hypothetical protein GLOTRDRAFT_136648 [Gloeophyllum trabeum ATCC 11539]